MRRQELLHGLREREFDVHLPAPGQHHDEERQATPSVADGNGSELPPVDLGDLAGREGQRQERFAGTRTNRAHVVLDDADAPAVALVAQALKDLLRAQRVGSPASARCAP